MKREDNLARILVSSNDSYKRGHSWDLRFGLRNTRFSNQIIVFQDVQKKPDLYLQLALEEILLSNVILLDATSDDEAYKDRLIKFGIAFALEKQRYFFYIKENSQRISKIKSTYLDGHIIEALGYYDFIEVLNEKLEILSTQAQTKPQKPTETVYKAFSVLGINESTNPDLRKTLKDFALEKGWHAGFYKPPSGTNIHEELSRQVCARTFSLFCLNKFADVSVYIAIGLALGCGIPLLVIIEEGIVIPQILSGYTGVINYTSNTDLIEKLTKYTEIFLSPEIFKTWEGFTYFYLLSKTEKRLNEVTSKVEIEEIERIILAITNVGRAPLTLAYILLGDIFRRKAQILDPMNTSYLQQAIFYYEKALSIQPDNQRSMDGIESTKELIQLIDLIVNKNFDSIPELIYIIGNNINLEQYQYLRSFLLDEIKNLINSDEFLHAIALLAAIQKFDASEEVSSLWKSIDPKHLIEKIQNYQQAEIKIKSELKLALEKIEDTTTELGRANKAIEQAKQLQSKLESTMDYYGQEIFVNFGVGWATYRPIKGLPYVKHNNQNDQKETATEGMTISRGDWVYDGDDNYCFHMLSKYESAILAEYKKLTS
jgi:hypothetical protein